MLKVTINQEYVIVTQKEYKRLVKLRQKRLENEQQMQARIFEAQAKAAELKVLD